MYDMKVRGDDLTDWISSFQSDEEEAFNHSLSRWESTKAVPWLIAAISKAEGDDAKSTELIRAALNIRPNSPAFAAGRYHAVRLMIEAGKKNEARTLLDQLLTNNRGQFDESSRNLLTVERMLLANSLD